MFEVLTFETSLGSCGLAWSRWGLKCVRPFETGSAEALSRLPDGARVEEADAPGEIAALIASLRAFLEGEPVNFGLVPLDMASLSVFEIAVYGALRGVGWGETVSYGELARRIGADAGSARAVGAAMGRNPWPLVVPCHRVLTSDGKPGGFSAPGGGRTKRMLLAREGVHFDDGQLGLFG